MVGLLPYKVTPALAAVPTVLLLVCLQSSLNNLKSRESIRIVAALGRILSLLSSPEITQLLQGMLAKQSSRLKELSVMEVRAARCCGDVGLSAVVMWG